MKFLHSFLLLSLFPCGLLSQETGFATKETKGQHLDILRNGKIVARYMTAYETSTPESTHETYKPFLHVMSGDGATPITKGPGGDFTHHRGIFYGFNKTKTGGKSFDRWHMKDGAQVHKEFQGMEADADKAAFTSLIDWNDNMGAPYMKEERKFVIRGAPLPFGLSIEMTSKLTSVAGDVSLDGDPEHAGAQFRPANEVDRKKTVYYFPGTNTDPKKNFDLPWAGETFHLKGSEWSVVILNHPSNPSGSIFSAYRDYGRFGVFPKGTAGEKKPFAVRYLWLVKEGEMPPVAEIQKQWNAFAGEEKPVSEWTVRPVAAP